MEVSSSRSVECGMHNDLEELLQVFGSGFSLDDITSAYLQSRLDKNLAAEILCSHESTSTSTNITAEILSAENAPQMNLASGLDRTRVALSKFPSLENASEGKKGTRELKSKNCSASMGSVSCVIGKEYAKSGLSKNEVIEVKKPLKLDCKDFPVSELWSEKTPSSTTTRGDIAQTDVEEFLFKMLGEGFQLDMPVIQEVLGICGYDMQKSIDKLLDLSATPFSKCEDIAMAVENSIGKCSDQNCVSLQEQMQQLESAQSDGTGLIEKGFTGSPEKLKDRTGLQQELLQALFDVPDRSEEAPKITRLVRAMKKPKPFIKRVSKPPKDATSEVKPVDAEPQATTGEEDADTSYEVLRTAVKEYLITMKEYYKAAVDAFVKGDHARANKLLEQGQFFNQKAREADDISCQKLVQTREAEIMSLKLHNLEPKEALKLLRLHLTSISGISSIKYLRIIIEGDDEGTSKGERKRKLIMKQLEKESIKWNDESDGKAILIQVDLIDPKRLSFVKKQEQGDLARRGYYF